MASMTQLIEKLAGTKALVVGDVMLDRYWYGGTGRISPEAPVPVVRVEDQQERAGGAGNVALNLASVGCQVRLLGMSGSDDAGDALAAIFDKVDIDASLSRVDTHPTITKLRVMSRNQQLLRMDFEVDLQDADHAQLQKDFTDSLPNADVVVLSDYCKGTLPDPQFYIEAARSAGTPLLVDPKRVDLDAYRGASLLTPNMSEFESVAGACGEDEELIAQRGQQLLVDFDIESLLITRSEHGMLLLQKDRAAGKIAAQAREVFDVTGAGDTVVAIVAAVLGAGEDMESACNLANTAAGIVVGKLGTATVSPAELRSRYLVQDNRQSIVEQSGLVEIVDQLKANHQRVVMTNGCFDLLHPGHLAYLQAAAELGDILVVAVNDDASVERLKGDGRPVNPLAVRMAMLAGLSVVDYVVGFSEDTPQQLIGNVIPDVLVKGGDYKVEEVAGYDEVTAAGGEVRILGFLEGYSTSDTINKIKSSA